MTARRDPNRDVSDARLAAAVSADGGALRALLKLYPRIVVPAAEHADYYICRVLRAADLETPLAYAWARQAVEDVADLAASLGAGSTPLDEAGRVRTKIVSRISAACGAALGEPLRGAVAAGGPPDYPEVDAVGRFAGARLARLDLVGANWAALRKAFGDAVPLTWEAACAEAGAHPAIARSKAFRQSTLGLLNPKLQRAVQTAATAAAAAAAEAAWPGFKTRLARRSPDELTVAVETTGELEAVRAAVAACQLPARLEVLELRRLTFSPGYTQLNFSGLDDHEPASLRPFCVPGDRFHLWLTRVVYGTKVLDQRDTLFTSDGRTASWLYDFNKGEPHAGGAS